MTESLRFPISMAEKKGVLALAAMSQNQRLVLTRQGRPVAIVDSAERLDTDVQRMREATWAVLEAAANLVGERSEAFDLDGVCALLGIDPKRVRERSLARRGDSQRAEQAFRE